MNPELLKEALPIVLVCGVPLIGVAALGLKSYIRRLESKHQAGRITKSWNNVTIGDLSGLNIDGDKKNISGPKFR